MRILAVTHGPLVRPELFADVIDEDGHELQEWDIRLRGAPPRDFDAVLVFGGDQNVGDELQHPWLHEEYEALRHWVHTGTPLLGSPVPWPGQSDRGRVRTEPSRSPHRWQSADRST